MAKKQHGKNKSPENHAKRKTSIKAKDKKTTSKKIQNKSSKMETVMNSLVSHSSSINLYDIDALNVKDNNGSSEANESTSIDQDSTLVQLIPNTDTKIFEKQHVLNSLSKKAQFKSSLHSDPAVNINRIEHKMAKYEKHKNVLVEKRINRRKCKPFDSENVERITKKIEHDIRRAPELNVQVDTVSEAQSSDINENNVPDDKNRVAVTIKLCSICNMHHLQDICPLQNPRFIIRDTVSHAVWMEQYQALFDEKYAESCGSDKTQLDTEERENLNKFSYALMSMPLVLFTKDSDMGVCTFAKVEIKDYTQFGPLVGEVVREVDIPEDFNMKDLWEVHSDKYHSFINTESIKYANWIKFVRPAPTREERNVSVICIDNELFLITIKNINAGEEILYWQDNIMASNKKKMEKTSKHYMYVIYAFKKCCS